MAARGITRKQLLKKDEFVEAAFDLGHWFEEHWRTVARVAAGIVAVALIVAVGFWWVGRSRTAARALLEDGIAAYDRAAAGAFADTDAVNDLSTALDSFDAALAKGGASANVARYYRGLCLSRLDRFEEAQAALQDYIDSAGIGDSLRWASQLLLAELYSESGDPDRAIVVLTELSEAPDEGFPTEQALLQLGELHMAQGDRTSARLAWKRVADEYPQSLAAATATELLSR